MEERELTEQGEAFITAGMRFYRHKVPFEEITGDAAGGEHLIVDLGNPLDFVDLRAGMRGAGAGILSRAPIHTVG